jgi:magnesium-transporting ATPase (P-type)
MKVLSLAHMCDVEYFTDKSGERTKFYNGPSPDEVALVEFASSMNFNCLISTEEEMKLKATLKGKYEEHEFKVYRKMEFNSDRKRMSILVKDPSDGKIKLLIKGADSIIKERLDKKQYPLDIERRTEWFLETASKQGLRTLLMGMKIVEQEEMRKFLDECAEAEKDLLNREAKLEEVYDIFERNIVLIGATAVEDRL